MNLYIDTHLNDIAIILFKESSIIKEKIITGEKQNSKMLMPAIKKVIGKNKIESIIVCNGPGSFTGVRLGVTIAKTLAYTKEIPIRTISSLECLAVSTEENNKIVGFSDKNGYYIGIFDENINLIGNYEYLSNSEYEEYTKKYPVQIDIELNYLKIYEFAMKKDVKNPHEVNPEYIKKLDVEK